MKKAVFFPLILFSTIGLIPSLSKIFQQLTLNYPLDLWEAGALVKSWQYQEGLPIYSSITSESATWMYGPFKLYLIGAFFSFTGFNFYIGRLLSFLAILITIFLLLKFFLRGQKYKLLSLYIALCLIFIYDLKLNIFITTRPEAIPILCSLIFLFIFYKGLNRKSLILLVASSIILVIGFFFKQTIAPIAIVPITAMIFSRVNLFNRTNFLFATIPFFSILISILYLYLFQPEIYHYMLDGPSQYEIPPSSLYQWTYRFLISIPLFYLFLYHWVTEESLENRSQKDYFNQFQDGNLINWVFAAILVMTGVGIIYAAKEGGTWNSLAYSVFSIYAFLLLRMENFLSALVNVSKINFWKAFLLSSMIGILILLGAFTGKASDFKPRIVGYGDSGHQEVLQIVQSLPGKVVCPQDPTIPLIAKGYAGQSIIFEYDASGYKWPLSSVLSEIRGADYVITLGKNGSWREWPFINHKQILQDLNFEPMELQKIEASDYQIWHKTRDSSN